MLVVEEEDGAFMVDCCLLFSLLVYFVIIIIVCVLFVFVFVVVFLFSVSKNTKYNLAIGILLGFLLLEMPRYNGHLAKSWFFQEDTISRVGNWKHSLLF